jgi:two-component system, chemotaxis family, protein-glutamate methylesterase/glutaminase
VPIADMGYVLADLLSKPPRAEIPVPKELEIEAEITERLSSKIQDLSEIGEQTIFNCPDCGGGLWKIKHDKVARYRCYTGHVYTEKILMQAQSEGIEETLWVAIRMLEERRNLLLSLSVYENESSYNSFSDDKKARAEGINVHIERLKTILQSINFNEPND